MDDGEGRGLGSDQRGMARDMCLERSAWDKGIRLEGLIFWKFNFAYCAVACFGKKVMQ